LITSIYDAYWWSVETITTVTYGEYYPVTAMGRAIAGVTMFAAIGFLWTFVGLVTRKVREITNTKQKEEQLQERLTVTMSTVANETKEMIKNKIDIIDLLDDNDKEDLIKLIRVINSGGRSNVKNEVAPQNQKL